MKRASSGSSAARRQSEFGDEDIGVSKELPRRATRIGIDCYPTILGPGTKHEFRRIVGSEQHADNRPIVGASNDPLWFRDMLVCTIPARVMMHAAKSWGDIMVRKDCGVNLGVLRMLSFFLDAVYQARLQRNNVRTWIEVILRETGDQPICFGLMANTEEGQLPPRATSVMRANDFERRKIAGYRIFAMLGHEFGPETLMRSALFGIQLAVKMITPGVYELKQRFLVEPDHERREAMMQEYALGQAIEIVTVRNKKNKRPVANKRKSAAAAFADDATDDCGLSTYDDDADESSTASAGGTAKPTAPDVLKEVRRIMNELYVLLRDEPIDTSARDYEMLTIKGHTLHHRSIATLPRYVEQVVAPAHYLAGIYDPSRIESACASICGDWKEARHLPEQDVALSVRETFSFEMSCLSLDPIGSPLRDEEKPTPVQMEYEAYFGPNGDRFHFPMPYCAWQVSATALNPQDFLNELLLWQGDTFWDELTRLELEVESQEIKRREELQRTTTVHKRADETPAESKMRELSTVAGPGAMRERSDSIKRLQDMTRKRAEQYGARMRTSSGPLVSLSSSSSSSSSSSASAKSDAQRHSDLFGEDESDGPIDEAHETRAYDAASVVDRAFRNIDLNQMFVNDVDFFSRSNDRVRLEVEKVQNGLKPTAEKYQELWKRSLQCVSRMVAPEGVNEVDFETHKYIIQCDLQRKISQELFDEIMNAMESGRDISDAHRSAYALLTRTGSIDHIMIRSPVPNMSVCSAMLVSDTLDVVAGTNMQNCIMHYHTLSRVIALQASSVDHPSGMLHTGVIGPPQSGKSMMTRAAKDSAVRGAIFDEGHKSKLHTHSSTFDGGHASVSDEADATMADHSVAAQLKNPDERARAKLRMTTGLSNTQRLEMNKDGKGSSTLHIEKERVAPQYFLGNRYKIQKESDKAPHTRNDVFIAVPEVDTAVTVGDRVVDPNSKARKERWDDICLLSQQSQAVCMFLLLAARCGLVRSLNVDLLRVMQARAMQVADAYVPAFLGNVRSIQRQLEYGTLCVFVTAVHTMFRSEASPLVQMADDLSDKHSTRPAYLPQLAQLMQPYLYANHEHGLWTITRMLTAEYPFESYRVLRIIAGLEGRFRRCLLKPVFEAHRVPLIDDEVRRVMEERKDFEAPLYIRALEQNELDIDHRTSARYDSIRPGTSMTETSMPKFYNLGRAQADRSLGTGNGHAISTLTSAAFGAPVATAAAAAARGRCDPNWIEIGSSQQDTIKATLGYLAGFVQVDDATMNSILDLANIRTVRHPVFELANYHGHECPASALAFVRDPADPTRQRVMYQESPITKFEKGRYLVLTYAMMLPPQMLLFLLLTSSENMFSREREVVIPLEIEKSPGLLYRHSIKKRPGKLSFTVISANAGVTRRRMQVQHGQSAFIDKIARSHRIFDQDPELEVFYDHMKASHLAPNYHEFIEMLSFDPNTKPLIEHHQLTVPPNQNPTAAQYKFMFDTWVNTHPAQPGTVEERAEWLYREAPMFASSKSLLDVQYPQTEMVETRIQSTVMHLERSNGIRPLSKTVYGAGNSSLLEKLRMCKRFVHCLQWRFPSHWHRESKLLQNIPERRLLIRETLDDLGVFTLPQDINAIDAEGALVALVPATPHSVPAKIASMTVAEFSKAGCSTLKKLAPAHLGFLEQYYAHRAHFSKVAIAMTDALLATGAQQIKGLTTPDPYVPLDVIKAQEVVLRGLDDSLYQMYKSKLRDAKAREASSRVISRPASSASAGSASGRRRCGAPSIVTEEDSRLLWAYRAARDWTRGMRAVIGDRMRQECESAIQFMAIQNAVVRDITTAIARSRECGPRAPVLPGSGAKRKQIEEEDQEGRPGGVFGEASNHDDDDDDDDDDSDDDDTGGEARRVKIMNDMLARGRQALYRSVCKLNANTKVAQ